MKYRIYALYLDNGIVRFTVKTKEHWWNRWHYIYDGQYPRLFQEDELERWILGKKLNNEL